MPSPRPATSRLRPGARTAALAVAGALLVAPLVLGPAAWAHDVVVGSTPAPGSTLTTAPTAVTVSFDEPPLAAGLAVAVTAPDRTMVTAGDPVLSGTMVTAALVPLTVSGDYTVAWRVVADDGHPVTGTFGFTLDLGATASASASPASPSATAAPATHDDGSSAAPLLAGVAVVLVAIASGIGVALRRRSG